ncbi:hypothetical protein LOAG_12603 [Loa loa]|uniref:Maelstrom domain-containing protein n=1 Tax=Loa loa TaxID=7209 RepID=A0A1S0TL06_LOALO|nr:hypothetical protein LOAG_12603 [Loa loa]EFO15905.2 hypothetical protein LOAG_12603 [Loa loa]
MGKGASDKQTGFWMYMKYFIKPKLQQELGRQVKTIDLVHFGLPYWAELSDEEKEEWKEKAKEYNRSEARQNERMLRLLENHRRNHHVDEQTNFAQRYTFRKLKPSNIMPPSCRYDEIDQYSRKYFAGINDDFEGKRENDRKEFIDRYQWKFAQDRESMKDFFYEAEIIVVTANVYCEDSSNERMVPSEISILKFSIKHGIHDQRHYILGFAERELCENSKAKAKENEQITGLLMDWSRMPANIRFDYVQLWNEIKAFTGINGDGVKLLLLSKDWNRVVGSFDALFVHANEKSFSRIETRFATLEDYFMALYATVHDTHVNDEIKSDVAIEMSKPWHRAVFFDLITCDFHAALKYTVQCQAENCSLFTAHKAAFSFFTLYKKHIFPSCRFTERHAPNKALLPAVEDEKDRIFADLSLLDTDSDTELFYDASIPSSSLYGQGFLMPAPQELARGMSEASSQILSKVSQDRITPSKEGSIGCSPNLSSFPQKVSRSSSPDDLIPERTLGGFCIPNVYQTDCSYIRRNLPLVSTSSRGIGSRQEKSEVMANQKITPRNPHRPSQSLTRYEQKVSANKLQHELSSDPIQPLIVNGTVRYICTNQKANVTKPLILEPVICKEAEMFGWSENLLSSDPDQKFVRWLNSAYFEPKKSRSNRKIFFKIENDYENAI